MFHKVQIINSPELVYPGSGLFCIVSGPLFMHQYSLQSEYKKRRFYALRVMSSLKIQKNLYI